MAPKYYVFISFMLLSSLAITAQKTISFLPVSWVPANASILDLRSYDDGLFMATDKGLYHHKEGTTKQLSSLYIDALAIGKEATWIASGDQIMELGSNQQIRLPRQSAINALELVGNTLWIAAEGGLFKAGIGTGKVEELTDRNSKFKRSAVNFVHKDRFNILWIGTDDGEYRVENDKWKQYHKGIKVVDYFENQEGMWFISPDDMWLIDEYNREYPVGLDTKLVTGKLKDFCLDAKGTMYLASDKFVIYDPYKTSFTDVVDEIGDWTPATSALLAYKGGIIAGTKGKGMYTLHVEESNVLKVNVVQETMVTCANGTGASFTAYASGGESPYTYTWSKGSANGAAITGLGIGEVKLIVKDGNGHSLEKIIEVADVVKPKILLDHVTPAHEGLNDGAIYLQKTKGHTFLWSTGTDGNELKTQAAGDYTIVVTDANGCSADAKFTIPEVKGEVLISLEGVAVGEVVRADNILFKADSTEVLEGSIPVLEQILAFMANNPRVKIEVGGHTNTIPSHEYCDQLSTERAKNIAQFFYKKGIPQDRLSYKGYGKRQPLTQDTSLEGRRRNQRVEIKVLAR